VQDGGVDDMAIVMSMIKASDNEIAMISYPWISSGYSKLNWVFSANLWVHGEDLYLTSEPKSEIFEMQSARSQNIWDLYVLFRVNRV